MKNKLQTDFSNLKKCSSSLDNAKHRFNLLKEHKNIVILPEGKGKSVTVMFINKYRKK